jgi:pullulanase/glycogen debranching enzyme
MKEENPYPLGATTNEGGVNFDIFSANAAMIELCLFDDDGATERERVALPEHRHDIWHGYLPGAAPGLMYGYCIRGPNDPLSGHRFNPHKLLVDPYAKALTSPFAWSEWTKKIDTATTSSSNEDTAFFPSGGAVLLEPRSLVLMRATARDTAPRA